MAITVQAPLAAQLFSLGAASNVGGGDTTFKGNRAAQPQGFSTGGGRGAPAPEKDKSGERSAALANVLQTGIQAYMGSQGAGASAAPDAQGNGFGLGGTLASGDANNPSYAQTTGPSLKTLFSSAPEPQINPADNGYRDTNPYALNYANNPSRKSLFNYSGSYGGATY